MAESFVRHTPEELEEALQALAREDKSGGEVLETLMRSSAFTLLDRPWPGHAAAPIIGTLLHQLHMEDLDEDPARIGTFCRPRPAARHCS